MTGGLAALTVIVIGAVALGWREPFHVAVAIPVLGAVALMVAWWAHQTRDEEDVDQHDDEPVGRAVILGAAGGLLVLLLLAPSLALARITPVYGWFYDRDCPAVVEEVRILSSGGAYTRIIERIDERLLKPGGEACRPQLLDSKIRALMALADSEKDPLGHLELARATARGANATDLAALITTRIELEQQKRMPAAPPIKVMTLPGVLFYPNQADLTPGAAGALREVCRAIASDPTVPHITIRGHTDSTGTPEKNAALSLARAQRVAERVGECGARADRIEVRGLGQDQPVASNDTAEGREQNRRVEILIESHAGAASETVAMRGSR